MSVIGAGCVVFDEFDSGVEAFEVVFSVAVSFSLLAVPSGCEISEGVVPFSDD